MSAADLVLEHSVTIQDFPKPGILFRDLTPVFADADAYRAVIDELAGAFAGEYDAVAGVEARGFLLSSAVAYAAHKPLIAVRKAGKLPGEVLHQEYQLEYGTAALEIRPGQLPQGSRVLILDDVLATGGSCLASAALIERAGYTVAGFGLVLELAGMTGRERLEGYRVHAIMSE
ncbi:adenine phosphoribosyltransferase [Mycetocola spongiae]|uniref:adenine phosphoribosyltransferase n=1 Tax=Mycetocola spongiae TaxID=2859226 RepID=UPI001CF1D0E5|nr:adenine phosphoribosyltransferase [Mycetocola spongiae]UCR90059.1 adenine phosphoribosyltransferase [Mycetocola spongiae]